MDDFETRKKIGRSGEKPVETFAREGDIYIVRTVKNKLAESRTGRIILHTACLIVNRKKAAWHWAGIKRELHR